MGCNGSVNVNFSDKSYQVNMFIYICYEVREKRAKKIWTSKNNTRIRNKFVAK